MVGLAAELCRRPVAETCCSVAQAQRSLQPYVQISILSILKYLLDVDSSRGIQVLFTTSDVQQDALVVLVIGDLCG